MRERHLSTSIFSFTVHEKAFQIRSCTVICKGDTPNIVQNWIIKKNVNNVLFILSVRPGTGPRPGGWEPLLEDTDALLGCSNKYWEAMFYIFEVSLQIETSQLNREQS